ncbi:MAG: hypothetical protein KDA45_13190 [Planctomycetales bacterium]|nr:hypothetical protein [Planctomycetales bacterium]
MRFRRFVVFAASLAVVVCATVNPLARAQESPQPVAIVSLAPLDRLLEDTSYLLRACNVPEIGGLVSIMATQYTQGLDRTKPIGVSVTLDGQMPTALIFLPISDRGQFFGALAGMGIEPEDLGDGLFEIDANRQTIFVKHTGDWLYVAQTEDALAQLPADPLRILGELPRQYNLAVRVNVQALPKELKDMATAQMRVGFQRSLAEQRNQTDEERETARQMGEAQIQQIEQLISDTEQVIFGWNVESSKQRVTIDVAAQFAEGSKLAGQVAAMENLSSDYTTFATPGSAAHFRFSSRIAEDDKAMQKQNLRNSMSQIEKQLEQSTDMPEETKAMLGELLRSLGKITEDTIDEGVFDGAASLSTADDTLRVLIGGRLADGRELEQALKQALTSLAGQSNAAQVDLAYGSHQGFTLHRVVAPLKIADPAAKDVLGDSLHLTLGTADKAFVVSLDSAGDASLKAAIDRMDAAQAKAVAPFDGVIEVGQILRFAQAISPNSILDTALQTIQQYSGKDKVVISGRMIPRGGMYRVAIEEGVLRAAGAAAKSRGGNGGF